MPACSSVDSRRPPAFEADEDTNASEFVAELEETLTVVEEVSGDMAVASEGADDEAGDEVVDAAGPEPDQQVGEAQRREGEAERQSDAAVTEVVTVTETEVIPDNVLDPAYAAFVRAGAINELLVETNADVLPGGFLRFVSITDDSITVRRVWQRGLAVGARGLTLEVDKVTGAVLRAANMGSMVP